MTFGDWFWPRAYAYAVAFLVLEGAVVFTWCLYNLVEYIRKELSL